MKEKIHRKQILHVITSLRSGGAEANLVKLCINDKINKHTVVSLSKPSTYSNYLLDRNINVTNI